MVIDAFPKRISGKVIHFITDLHKQIHFLNLQVGKAIDLCNTYKIQKVIKSAFDKANFTSPRSRIDKFRNVIFWFQGSDVKIRKVRHCCLQFEVYASQLSFSNVAYKKKMKLKENSLCRIMNL
jgi:hypothetical protein